MRRPIVFASLAFAPIVLLAGSLAAQETGEGRGTGYIEMPASTDGSYTLASPHGSGHNWGRPDFIRFVVAVAREWHRRHPELPKICVGDMSHEDASEFPPHKTHRDGLTADIVTRPVNICDIHYENAAHQVELAELFVAYGARQILFNGDAVVAKVKVAQKYELHDDHFHVVLDPKKLPDDSKPLLLPVPELSDGATFGGACVADGKLVLRWLALGAAKPKAVKVTFDEAIFTVKPGDTQVKVPAELASGSTHRWRLDAELASGETVGFDWQQIRADLEPPAVELVGPADGANVAGAPELSWTFSKPGAEQGSFVVELTDQGTKKPTVVLGPISGKGTAFTVRATPLHQNMKWHWRVRALDGHGNAGVSAWRAFKTSNDWRLQPLYAKVARACELHAADGSLVARLKKGDALTVTGEGGERLAVQTARGQEGFIARSDATLPSQ
jgi:hypothetical protein